VLGRSKEQSGGRHDNFFGDEGTSRWRATPLRARALATYGVTHGGTVVAHAWQRGLAAAVGKGKADELLPVSFEIEELSGVFSPQFFRKKIEKENCKGFSKRREKMEKKGCS